MKARKTRAPKGPRTRCAACHADCTDTEHAVTVEGAKRISVLADELVCFDCERRSRGVSSLTAGLASDRHHTEIRPSTRRSTATAPCRSTFTTSAPSCSYWSMPAWMPRRSVSVGAGEPA